jgi:hypothetical protein
MADSLGFVAGLTERKPPHWQLSKYLDLCGLTVVKPNHDVTREDLGVAAQEQAAHRAHV